MLARSGSAFPHEIYHLIFYYLEYSDFFSLLKVSRVLFSFTIPFVWKTVELSDLLKLLPEPPGHLGLGGMKFLLDNHYFSRFRIYAPHVERLTLGTKYTARESSTYLSRVPIQSYLFDHDMLPNLKTASLSFDMRSPSYQQRSSWVRSLIPATLRELIFEASSSCHVQLAGELLEKCSEITRFQFRIRGDTVQRWPALDLALEWPTANHLKSFILESPGIGKNMLRWMACLPELQTLRIAFSAKSGVRTNDLDDLTEDHCPPDSFRALRSLAVDINDSGWGRVRSLWLLRPLVRNVTHTAIEGLCLNGRTPQSGTLESLVATIATNSPKVHDFSIIESDAIGSRGLSLSQAQLTYLKSLPLRRLTLRGVKIIHEGPNCLQSVGNWWPHMEELSLDQVVELSGLLQLPTFLPKLRTLKISLPDMKAMTSSLSLSYGLQVLSLSDPPFEEQPHSPALSIAFRRFESHMEAEYDMKDIDFLARALAITFPNLNIQETSRLMEQHRFSERVTYYLNKEKI